MVKCVDYYEIGQRIRRARKAQGLSQEQLAELVKISTTHMSHIETGNTKLSLPVLVDLSMALHVSTDTLLFEQPVSDKIPAVAGIEETLLQCTPKQTQIILEIIRSAKTAMDKYE